MHICKMYAAYLQLIRIDSKQCYLEKITNKNLPILLRLYLFSSISQEGLNLQK